MTFRRSHKILAAGIAAASLLTGGMAVREPDGWGRMSAVRITNLEGYTVSDWNDVPVGDIASVETDTEGRTRWLNIRLHDGGIARVASFRADLDASHRNISVRLPEGLLLARAA